MKQLLIIALLLVGCDNSTEPKTTEWICTTDYQFESPTVSEECESTDPPCPPDAIVKVDFLNTIYNSLEECESGCPESLLEVSDLANPDGTGEYITFYCKNNN